MIRHSHWAQVGARAATEMASMLFGGRFGGGQQMSRGKMDALRARFMLVLDDLRERVGRAADALDTNYLCLELAMPH